MNGNVNILVIEDSSTLLLLLNVFQLCIFTERMSKKFLDPIDELMHFVHNIFSTSSEVLP